MFLAGVGAIAGCSGAATAATTPSAPVSASSPAVSTPTHSPSSSSSPPKAAPAPPRTADSLKAALLELADLPSGFASEPAGGGATPKASSKDPKCAAFIQLSNDTAAPGSTANASTSFSGGQSGPFISESIDALANPAGVAALQTRVKDAAASCTKIRLAVPGVGTSTVTVASVSAPKTGASPVATRMTAVGGPMAGLEITMVYTGVGDTILALSFIGATPDEIDGATSDAVDKAAKVLGTVGTASS